MSDKEEFKEVNQKSSTAEIDRSEQSEGQTNDQHTNSHEKSVQDSDIKKRFSSHLLGLGNAKAVLLILTFIAIGVAALFVWPTKWRYDMLTIDSNKFPIRIDRFTDQTEILYPNGWRELKSKTSPTESQESKFENVTEDELGKIEGRLSITNYGYLTGDLYNGTSKSLKSVQVRLTITNKGGDIDIDRVYEMHTSGGDKLESSEFNVKCGCKVQEGQDFSWNIVSATWK